MASNIMLNNILSGLLPNGEPCRPNPTTIALAAYLQSRPELRLQLPVRLIAGFIARDPRSVRKAISQLIQWGCPLVWEGDDIIVWTRPVEVPEDAIIGQCCHISSVPDSVQNSLFDPPQASVLTPSKPGRGIETASCAAQVKSNSDKRHEIQPEIIPSTPPAEQSVSDVFERGSRSDSENEREIPPLEPERSDCATDVQRVCNECTTAAQSVRIVREIGSVAAQKLAETMERMANSNISMRPDVRARSSQRNQEINLNQRTKENKASINLQEPVTVRQVDSISDASAVENIPQYDPDEHARRKAEISSLAPDCHPRIVDQFASMMAWGSVSEAEYQEILYPLKYKTMRVKSAGAYLNSKVTPLLTLRRWHKKWHGGHKPET